MFEIVVKISTYNFSIVLECISARYTALHFLSSNLEYDLSIRSRICESLSGGNNWDSIGCRFWTALCTEYAVCM